MRVCAVQHGGGALESMKNAAGASMSGPGGELDANGLGLFPCGPQDPGPSRSSEDDANIHHQSANGQSRNFFSFRSPFFSPPPHFPASVLTLSLSLSLYWYEYL